MPLKSCSDASHPQAWRKVGRWWEHCSVLCLQRQKCPSAPFISGFLHRSFYLTRTWGWELQPKCSLAQWVARHPMRRGRTRSLCWDLWFLPLPRLLLGGSEQAGERTAVSRLSCKVLSKTRQPKPARGGEGNGGVHASLPFLVLGRGGFETGPPLRHHSTTRSQGKGSAWL